MRFSENFLKKVFEKFGGLKNLPYLCTTFALRKVGNDKKALAKKVLKNFLKKVSKKFGGFKNLPYLCTTFPLQNSKFESELKNGSLIYWFSILREKCSIYLSISFKEKLKQSGL